MKLFRRNRGLSTGNSRKVGGHNNVPYRGPREPITLAGRSGTRRFESRLLQTGSHFDVTVTNDARDPPSMCAQQCLVVGATKARQCRWTICYAAPGNVWRENFCAFRRNRVRRRPKSFGKLHDPSDHAQTRLI